MPVKPVEVYYIDAADFAKPLHVATVEVADDTPLESALEFAFARTQNINGSWSQGPFIEGERNPDHHPAVTRHAPLHEDRRGNVYGLRSSMVGDRFVIDGKAYIVAFSGFKLSEAA